jgi:hypothetical protein
MPPQGAENGFCCSRTRGDGLGRQISWVRGINAASVDLPHDIPKKDRGTILMDIVSRSSSDRFNPIPGSDWSVSIVDIQYFAIIDMAIHSLHIEGVLQYIEIHLPALVVFRHIVVVL